MSSCMRSSTVGAWLLGWIAGGVGITVILLFLIVSSGYENCSFADAVKEKEDEIRTLKKIIKLANNSYFKNYHDLKMQLAVRDARLFTLKSDLQAATTRENRLRKRLGREENMIDAFEEAMKVGSNATLEAGNVGHVGARIAHTVLPKLRVRHNIMEAVEEALSSTYTR